MSLGASTCPQVQQTEQYSSFGSDNGLAPNRRQAAIWSNDGLASWRIYASLGLDELTDDSEGQSMVHITKVYRCVFSYFVELKYQPIYPYTQGYLTGTVVHVHTRLSYKITILI